MPDYISSRNKQECVSASEAVIKGLAPDGGLYTPASIDAHIAPSQILGLSYQETSLCILKAMLTDYDDDELRACVYGAYDQKFNAKEIVPLQKYSQGYLMELWHGPTSAFKDIALTILPRLLTCAYKKKNRSDIISILTATSGDTGKAALSGFADVPDTAITVFYPEIGVSAIQKRQMNTSEGNNVDVIAVRGNFDDCQRMVKEATSSKEVLEALDNVTISSANSINVGRLVPQVVYYYSSYAKLIEQGAIKCGDPVNFCVPTGNFGDILAGYLAMSLGLPINKLICASNANNVLTDFLNSGTYSLKRDFLTTMSPSMDILISSNLERLLFMVSDYDDKLVASLMAQLKEKKEYTVTEEMKKRIDAHFKGYWASEEDCANTIHSLWHKEGILIDPHTAVGAACLAKYELDTGDKTPCIVLSTASPYKFAHDVLKSIGSKDVEDDFDAMEELSRITSTPIPENLASLKAKPVRFTRVIDIKDGMHVIAARMKEIGNARS